MAKVTGIGGVFLQSKSDPQKLSQWYSECLGMKLEPWGGVILQWKEDQATDGGLTVWHTADQDSDWFSSGQSFMINYRVDDLDGVLEKVKKAGSPIVKEPETHPNGRFAWVKDPEGNKLELWEAKLWEESGPN